MGVLVTRILSYNNIPIPPGDASAGSMLIDKTFCVSTYMLGVYRPNPRQRAFQFTFECDGETQQELLPFPQGFSVAARDDWVLTPEQLHEARVAAGRDQDDNTN